MSRVAETQITSGKKSLVSSEQDEKKRLAFRRQVAELNVLDFVFVDEMGINIDLALDDGRTTPGERVVDTKPPTRGENLSVIGALGYDGMRAIMSRPGAVDGEACLELVQNSKPL